MQPRFRTPLLLTLLLTGFGTPAHAQPAYPQSNSAQAKLPTYGSAAEALASAQALRAQAQARYPGGSIDRTLWKQAANAAEAAVQLDPSNAKALQLRAEIYTQTGFWAKALGGWQAYFAAAGAQASASAREQAAATYYHLAYAAYTRADLAQASELLGECLNVAPDSPRCALWAGRVALESGDYAGAEQLYRRAAALDSGNKTAPYFASVAGQASRYGPEATRSFSGAYAALEEGRKADALAGFQRAAAQAPTFAAAQREAGRLALELGDAEAAYHAYAALSQSPAATDADRYNLRLAEEGRQFGLEAARAFRSGYAAYQAGNMSGAAQAFARATELSPNYAKAWAWLGRVQYEQSHYAAAADSYAQVTQLDPSNKAAAHFLRQAQLRAGQ